MSDELTLARGRVNFYEAGSGQEEIRDDWFTLLFEVTRVRPTMVSQFAVEASLNGATKLILKTRVLSLSPAVIRLPHGGEF